MSVYPLINKPTHNKNECHTIINNRFTNVFNEDSSSVVIIGDTSGHFAIFYTNLAIKN